ncbi:MAG: FAD-dependent oxidoreductase [Phycisphaerales bacterium]
MSDSPRSVIVLGGGVAGIASAVRLAQRGVKVTLI